MSGYDPFIRGPLTAQARTTEGHDTSRDRVFKCEIWNPSAAGTHPLVVYSHFSGGKRPAAGFLCWHICRHGYVVGPAGHLPTVVSDSAQAGAFSCKNRGGGPAPELRVGSCYMMQ